MQKKSSKGNQIGLKNVASSTSGQEPTHYDPEESTTHHEASDPTQFEPEDP